MDLIFGFLQQWIVPFLLVLSVVIFVHEMGHYLVAKWAGVRIEAFSIGFGPELIGWNDSAGTRWKISALPLGGYVKMFGDADAASTPDFERLRAEDAADAGTSGEAEADDDRPRPMTAEERAVSFFHKPLGKRAAIVAAGPIANFLLCIVLMAGIFMTEGRPYTPAVVGAVAENSAAAEAGFRVGDEITALDGVAVTRFEDLSSRISLARERPMTAVVQRDGAEMEIVFTPRLVVEEDAFGNRTERGRLGIGASQASRSIVLDPATALGQATVQTYVWGRDTLVALSEIIVGERSTDQLGGPLRIAKMTGDVSTLGIVALLTLAALLSVNLGLINLFPIPMLDGGHLVFYFVEWIKGRPLGERAQEVGYRIGLAMVVGLMLFVTWNDIVQMFVEP